jgi:sulfur-oxidizing protein SoxY
VILNRRHLLKAAFALTLAGVTRRAWAGAERNVNAFNGRSVESALGALDLPTAEESSLIDIDAPDVAENGANVPVEVTVRIPGADRVLVVGERNVFPLLADTRFTPGVLPWFEFKVKLAETSHIRVYVVAGDRLYTTSRQVRVIVGGCLPG